MNGMTTRHLVGSTSRAKEKFLADRAIGFVLSTLAVVVVIQAFVDTHSAIMTMLEILSTTDTAEPTVCAMIRLLIGRHPQIADIAVVVPKFDSA
jgi:hypothetical protein